MQPPMPAPGGKAVRRHKATRRLATRSSLLALEPRLLFDGAIAVTADAAGVAAGADALLPAEPPAPSEPPPRVADRPDAERGNLTVTPKWAEPLVANPDLREVPADTGAIAGNVITGGAEGEQADINYDSSTIILVGVTTGDTGDVPMENVGQPLVGAHGTLVLGDDGSYTYTPDASVARLGPGESTEDVFSYMVSDDAGHVSATTLTIRYFNDQDSGGNLPPVANPDVREADVDDGALAGNVISGGAPGDVADTDPEGDAFGVVGVVAGDTGQVPIAGVREELTGTYGTLVLGGDGSYVYTPGAAIAQLQPGESTEDVFSYAICDEAGNVSTTTLTVRYSNDAAPGPGPAPTPVPGPGPAPGPAPGPGPVPVAPPTGQPIIPVPLPPDGGGPGFGGVQPYQLMSDMDDPTRLAREPYTLLGPSAQPLAAGVGPDDLFEPFGPASVLGMVETAPTADGKLGAAKLGPAAGADAGDDDATPRVVKRAEAMGPAESDTHARPFSEQVREQAREVGPGKHVAGQPADGNRERGA